jgi:hypothetical protein
VAEALFVDDLVRRISMGESSWWDSLLEGLPGQSVFTAKVRVTTEQNGETKTRVTLKVIKRGEKKLIPIFTSEDLLHEWLGLFDHDGRKTGSFQLAAGDLALTLEDGAGMIINPGSIFSLELSPEQVKYLADAPIQPAAPTPKRVRLNEPEEIRYSARNRLAISKETKVNEGSERVKDKEEHRSKTQKFNRLTFNAEQNFVKDLVPYLKSTSAIREAYFLHTGGELAAGVVGLLANALTSEKRFELISHIADLAKAHFGSAGAIEVFDDLADKSSRSWDLFNTISPIYEASESELRKEVEVIANQPKPIPNGESAKNILLEGEEFMDTTASNKVKFLGGFRIGKNR